MSHLDLLAAVRSRYPRQVDARDGRRIDLRLMEPGDRERVLEFARGLPQDDLLFLRTDITQPEIVDEWIRNIEAGRTVTVLAFEGSSLLGDGSLHFDVTTWTRHIGEIRLLLAPQARGAGLGRILAEDLYAVGKELGLQMLTARMTFDQTAAMAVFRQLGFQREAVLSQYVIDRSGQTHDLLIATRRL